MFSRPASVIFRSVLSSTGEDRSERSLGVAQQWVPPLQYSATLVLGVVPPSGTSWPRWLDTICSEATLEWHRGWSRIVGKWHCERHLPTWASPQTIHARRTGSTSWLTATRSPVRRLGVTGQRLNQRVRRGWLSVSYVPTPSERPRERVGPGQTVRVEVWHDRRTARSSRPRCWPRARTVARAAVASPDRARAGAWPAPACPAETRAGSGIHGWRVRAGARVRKPGFSMEPRLTTVGGARRDPGPSRQPFVGVRRTRPLMNDGGAVSGALVRPARRAPAPACPTPRSRNPNHERAHGWR